MAEIFKKGASLSNVSEEVKEIDRELEELIKKQSAKIKVIGVGGAGNNSLSRMREIGIRGENSSRLIPTHRIYYMQMQTRKF